MKENGEFQFRKFINKNNIETKSKLHKKYKNKILVRKNNGLYTETKVIKETVYIYKIIYNVQIQSNMNFQ